MSARLTRRVSRAVALVSSTALVTAVALFAVATASGGKPGAALQTYTVPGILFVDGAEWVEEGDLHRLGCPRW